MRALAVGASGANPVMVELTTTQAIPVATFAGTQPLTAAASSASGILVADVGGQLWQAPAGSLNFARYSLATGPLRGVSATPIGAVGDSGDTLVLSGGATPSAITTGSANLRAVWGSGPSAALVAVGDGGAIARWDGVSWTPQVSNVKANLTGVFGIADQDVYACADDGSILHYAVPGP
jgi:hypothetical protein